MSHKYRKQITDFLIKNYCDLNDENIEILMNNYAIWKSTVACPCSLCRKTVSCGLLAFLNEFQASPEMKEVAFSNKFKDVIDG